MVNIIPISSIEELQNMDKTGHYKLIKNIDCKDFKFESIPRFEGTLDGAGHTIKNLKIEHGGLIHKGEDVTIKNIQFDNLNVKGCAGLICNLYGKCKFKNVIIKNSTIISSCSVVGGFIGEVNSSSVVTCDSTVTCNNCKLINSKVSSGDNFVGGFISIVNSSSVSFSECDVSKSDIIAGSDYVGGFVGLVNFSSIIVNESVVEKSELLGNYGVGGFVGYVANSFKIVSIRNSMVSDCKINAQEKENAGSIIGFDYYKKSVISNVPVLNTKVMVGWKQHVTNKVGNIDIEDTIRGHLRKVPSRKSITRKTTARRVPVRKPTARKTTCKRCATKRMVGKVRANYRSML